MPLAVILLVKVNFDAKSVVKFDGKTYNYYGKIIGKDPESYIILSAHYDSYFSGFQDDNAAIGLMMSIAKGLVDSGYKPEKTIIFNALAAEDGEFQILATIGQLVPTIKFSELIQNG